MAHIGHRGNTWGRRVTTGAACALLLIAAWSAAAGRGTAARVSAAPQNGNGIVRTAPPGTRVAGEPGKKGDTYYWFEGQIQRATARFADATVVAARGSAGEVHAAVRDLHGNDLAKLSVTSNSVQYAPTAGPSLLALNDSGERPSLDWSARQAYALWTGGTANVEWRSGFIRSQRAAASGEPRELETKWANGLTAVVSRKSVGRIELAKGRFAHGDVLKGELTKDGLTAGIALWFDRDRVFAWDIPGLTKGWIGPEHLHAVHGGWPFTPDMQWLNLQLIAFHHFQTLINANGFVARRDACGRKSWADAIANVFVPTLHANEPGCDGLHWLDGTVYRMCCDIHDYCFSKFGCTSKTWWMIWTSWKCDLCNVFVIDCFLTGGDTWNPGDA
jgi:hypothetical protein